MAAPERAKWKTFGLGTVLTASGLWLYPSMNEVRVGKTAVFDRRLTIGAADLDSDDLISTLSLGDWSGGGQVEEMSGADQSRYWWGIFDGRSPRQAALPPLVNNEGAPSGASGTCTPLGVVNDTAYLAFGTDICGWDAANDTWYTRETMTSAPVSKGTRFQGKLWVPQGSAGYAVITESAAGNPVVSTVTGAADPTDNDPVPTSNPRVVHFCTGEGNKLFALTTEGGLAWTFADDASAIGDAAWHWDYNEGEAYFPQIESSATPRRLVSFFNRAGVPTLVVVHSKGAHLYNRNVPQLEETPIQFPDHDNLGKGACVWRAGEDLWLTLGLDTVHYTAANVVVPFSGVNRDAGVPAAYRGHIVDLEPEISTLYALVAPGTTEVYQYLSKHGTDGAGNGQFDTPLGAAWSAFNDRLYVLDSGNDRVQYFQADGTFAATFAVDADATGGIAVRTSDGNVFVPHGTLSNPAVEEFSATGTSITNHSLGDGNPDVHSVALNQTSGYLYLTQPTNDTVVIYDPVAGMGVTVLGDDGSIATGDQPTPIAISPLTGDVYVGCLGDHTIEQYTSAGAFLRAWGSEGSGDGQFLNPIAIAIDPNTGDVFVGDDGRDDIQQFTSTGFFVRVIGESGTGDGQFAAIGGMAFDEDEALYVTDTQSGDDRVQKLTLQDGLGNAHLQGWSGIGWQGMWEGGQITPSQVMVMQAGDNYDLWWGADDGNAYRMELPPGGLRNPRQDVLTLSSRFASSGYIETSRADMGMLGFRKIASHAIVFMRSATTSEKLTILYEVDDGGWQLLGEVTEPGRTVLPLRDVALTLDDASTETVSRGIDFDWIRFRLELARGANVQRSPVIRAFNLHFLKVPQNSTTFQFSVPLPRRKWNGRRGEEIADTLDELLESREMVFLRHHDRLYRGRISQVTGVDATGQDFFGVRNVNFVEVQTNEDE